MSLAVRIDGLGLVRLVEKAQALEEFEEGVAALARALPADPGAIIDFFDVATGDAFDVAPEQAIGYFKAKGLKPTFSYLDMQGMAHDHAFTVAKMMDVDMLGQVRASLDAALAGGQTFKEWSDSIIPVLQSGGWWGRKEVIDPLTKQVVVAQLGSPWRLETIFRTNMQTAYAAGAWQEIQAQKELAPFLMYDAVDDFRTRPAHAAWDKKVLPVDHDWWSSHYPPNGYNCRCGVIQLSQDELDALGLQVSPTPKDGSYDWTNPRTGEELKIPNGLDPGFVNNAGESWEWKAKQLLKEKTAALQADMQMAAEKAAQKAAAEQAKIAAEGAAAAQAAQAALVKAQAEAALTRAKALAEEKSKQWVAQQQLDLIAKGKETAGAGAAFKIKALAQLKKGPDWADLKPTEQLAQLDALAAELKNAQKVSQGLSIYKKAILEGKTPPPAAVKAFGTLSPEEAEKWLAKVTAEKAAIDAKKAAEAAAAAQAAAKAQTSEAAKLIDGTPPDPATMTVIGRKTKGGTEGALYQDTATGTKWLVKFNGSEDAVRNEVLASKLYTLAGVEAPELHAITINGRPALASRIIDGIVEAPAKVLAATPTVREGFAVDAWLANWDVAGLNIDNVVLVGGRAVRIDVGGSLRYRAIGGLKGSAFGRSVGEIESLRDGTNAQARQIFGTMTAAEVETSVERVLAIADDDIRSVVMRYGPPDDATRRELADLMIARKADLARRFPAAAERVRARARAAVAEPAAPARVTQAEQELVEASRVNGYGFATDSDQIEDNMVVVHAYRRANDAEATRGFFKLLPGASKTLRDSVAAVAGGGVPVVSLGTTRQAILEAVKSINFRASKGEVLDLKVVNRVKSAMLAIDGSVRELTKAAATATNRKELEERIDFLTQWRKEFERVFPDAEAGRKATALRQFEAGRLPDELEIRVPSAAPGAPSAVKWRKVEGSYAFDTASFDRSFAKENGGKATVDGAYLRYEGEMPDGTRVTYFPHDPKVAWAMQGVVKIDVQGRGVDSTARVFSAIDEIGVKSTRATELDRQHLYLNAYARIALSRTKKQALRQFEAITDRTDRGLQQKLGMLQAATGIDVTSTEGWRQIDGVRQAFGHGRAYQIRPDLELQQLAEMDKTHVVFHNPQGLGTDAGSGVFERLKVVIDGGGMFASLTDRVRRGVPLSGSSVSSDLASGGGDYHFTRIRPRSSQKGTGVYWRSTVLRRMDAISYDSDNFGRTTGDHVVDYRRGQTVADLKAVSTSSSNETIFKGGLSIFDDIDRIVLSSEAEVKGAISWMQQRGYKTWPDGRKLEEVIITKAKHSAKP